jgi:hypothetical protein
LPESIIPDNSFENIVLCFWDENREKEQQTPISWLAEKDPDRWTLVQQNIAHWNPDNKSSSSEIDCDNHHIKPNIDPDEEKWKRFFVKTEDILKEYTPNNLLGDASYIATEARDYLGLLYKPEESEKNVIFTRGVITGELRKYYDIGGKDRSDFRNHAEDAAIVACTDNKEWQRISSYLQTIGYWKRYKDAKLPTPWKTFIYDLKLVKDQIVVSHKPDLGVRGGLHGENFLPLHEVTDKSVWIKKDTAEKDVYAKPGETNHVEIFCLTNKGRHKYISYPQTNFQIIKRIIESQKQKKSGQDRIRDCVHLKTHPDFPDAKYVMSLGKGEVIKMKSKSDQVAYVRITSASADKNKPTKIELETRPIFISNELILDKDEEKNKEKKDNLRQEWRLQGLKDFEQKILAKVIITPMGEIRWSEIKHWGPILGVPQV